MLTQWLVPREQDAAAWNAAQAAAAEQVRMHPDRGGQQPSVDLRVLLYGRFYGVVQHALLACGVRLTEPTQQRLLALARAAGQLRAVCVAGVGYCIRRGGGRLSVVHCCGRGYSSYGPRQRPTRTTGTHTCSLSRLFSLCLSV